MMAEAAVAHEDIDESLHTGAQQSFDDARHEAALAQDAPKVAALRAAVQGVAVAEGDEYWKSDHCLHRFLVARSYDVKKAAEQYTHTVQHRQARKCASLLTPGGYQVPEVMRKCFPWGFTGLDKQGFPVLVERIGAIDLEGMQKSIGLEEFLTFVCYYHELQERLMRRVSAKAGKNRHKVTCIIDMGGVQLRHLSSATVSIIKARARLEEDFYPEVVKRVFLVNTPSIFATVWSVVKLFVDEGTRDKMRLLGSGFLPTLLEFVDEDVIPQYLGGKLKDASGVPECTALVCAGGMVPLGYIAQVGTDRLGLGEEVTIPAGKHSDVLLSVPVGSTVRWRWGTGTAAEDVDFSVCAGVENESSARAPGSPAAGAAAGSSIRVGASVLGAHQLARGYAGPVPHGQHKREHAPVSSSPGKLSDPLSIAVPLLKGTAPHDVHPTARLTSHIGEFTASRTTAPLSQCPDTPSSTHVAVRLRWSNGFSWLSGKTLARRVDVLLPGGAWGTVPVESDPAERLALLRQANIEAFGM